MSEAGERTPEATRRRHIQIGAITLLVLAVLVVFVATRRERAMPTEVWVPAAAVGPTGDRTLIEDVRLAPGGRSADHWRRTWIQNSAGEPCLFLRAPIPLWKRTPIYQETDCFRFSTGGFHDSGERRDVDGETWARLAWFEADEMRVYLRGTK